MHNQPFACELNNEQCLIFACNDIKFVLEFDVTFRVGEKILY